MSTPHSGSTLPHAPRTPGHGGPRPGAGRKPKHGTRMAQKTVRLPQAWIDQLTDEFGEFQKGIETLVKRHLRVPEE